MIVTTVRRLAKRVSMTYDMTMSYDKQSSVKFNYNVLLIFYTGVICIDCKKLRKYIERIYLISVFIVYKSYR